MIEPVNKVAFVGDYLPRKCGIATFTTDLCEAVSRHFPETQCLVLPVNDRPEGYDYPEPVRFEIEERDLESYQRAAEFLNISNVDVVCVQHEFGIYGGPAGAHLLALLRELRMPVVTTLHTVLREPNAEQRAVMDQLATLTERFVVMTKKGEQFLRDIYDLPVEKIDVIPHGIPDVPFVDSNYYKDQFDVEGKTVILTFGLMSPGKGIEHMIEALPEIVKEHPEVIYIVLGATHPNLVRDQGESYRLSLQRLAEARGVEKNITFYDQFVTLDQLTEFLGAADLYITPYLNEAQITSGTLAYAVGAGKAVISTPYWHAQELLADGRGILVPFNNPGRIAEAVKKLLDDELTRNAMRRSAYKLGREMVWPRVAELYMQSYRNARSDLRRAARKVSGVRTLDNQPYQLPPLKLSHLINLTDSTGILQHAIYTVPKFWEGYTTDDNARAFILALLLSESGGSEADRLKTPVTRYLAFLWAAFDRESRRFRNLLSYDRRWLDQPGDSEDAHARALWAMGTALGRPCPNAGFRELAAEVFELGLPATLGFTSPRAWAFSLLAIHEYLRKFAGDRAANSARDTLTDRLSELYERVGVPDWKWCEKSLSYDNAVIPHALILSGHFTGRRDVLELGLDSLRWLAKIQTSETGCFSPIGSNGFYTKGGRRARFDQQPLEAQSMISACLEAHRITRDESWITEAHRAFEWFLGRNDVGLPLYDSSTGGCRDGLHEDRTNANQGAESTLAFHLALAEIRLAYSLIPIAEIVAA